MDSGALCVGVTDDLPSLRDVRATLIDALRFEGDQGLWEVVWRLNADHPTMETSSKIALARDAVFGLVAEGSIALNASEWPRTADAGRPLTNSEIGRLRTDDRPWLDPAEARDLVVWLVEPQSA